MLEKLKTIFIETTGINNTEITKDTVLKNDLGLTSFDLAQLACNIEDEFDVEIPDRAIKEFKTVGDVMVFLENN